jgi:hypothetical protein
VKGQLKGFAQLVRYADDFIVCFQYDDEARAFGIALRERRAKFGLAISEEKSRIIKFGRYACQQARKQGKKCATFDFLGFTLYCDITRYGKFKVGRKTSSKKFRQKINSIVFSLLIHCQNQRYIISMPYPNKSRGCTPEEPDEEKLHVRFCEGAHSNRGANTLKEG